MKLTIHGPNLNDQSQGTFHVHTARCRDNAREVKHNGSVDPYTMDVASVMDVVDVIYPADQFEDRDAHLDAYIADFHFAPCVKNLSTTNDGAAPATPSTNPTKEPIMATSKTTPKATKTTTKTTAKATPKRNGTARKPRAAAAAAPTPTAVAKPAAEGFAWPKPVMQLFNEYLATRVTEDAPTFDNPTPFINANNQLFVHSTSWRAWLLAAHKLEPTKSQAAQPMRELGMSVRAYPLPGDPEGRALGFYTGPAPAGTDNLPRRAGRASGPRQPRNPLSRLTDAQREVVVAALTAYKPTRANKAHADVRDELLALLP
jgi:hypothetical protein